MLKPAYNFHVHDVGIFDDLHGVGKTALPHSGIDKPKNYAPTATLYRFSTSLLLVLRDREEASLH